MPREFLKYWVDPIGGHADIELNLNGVRTTTKIESVIRGDIADFIVQKLSKPLRKAILKRILETWATSGTEEEAKMDEIISQLTEMRVL